MPTLHLKQAKKAEKEKKEEKQENKTKKSLKLPKIAFSKKKAPEQDLPTVAPALPKTMKVVDKYSLYEPFAQVAIVQDPKTGEFKYVLDELQLDPF